MKKVEDEILVESYQRLGNIWKVGEEVGLSGQQVHYRLRQLGVAKKINLWTKDDDNILKEKYIIYKLANKLDVLAKELGRTKQFICRKAKGLGLTDKNNKVVCEENRYKLSERMKKYIREKGHPRGFLGHRHTEQTRKILSKKSLETWKDPNSRVNSEDWKQRSSDVLHLRKIENKIRSFSIRGDHKIKIQGKEYIFKSKWEVSVALKLQEMLKNDLIDSWGYETKHFVFNDMKRGMRSYCPDFEITLKNKKKIYIEVKGWQMPSSMKRIEMFKERYPNVKLYLMNAQEYGKSISESDYLWRRCVEI